MLAFRHTGKVRYRARCQIAGCGNPAVTQLAAALRGLPTLAEVATAPVRGCCDQHEELVSNRYGAAVDWALLRERTAGGPLTTEVVERICAHLHGMDTAWTRSLHRLLDCLPGPS